MSPRPLDLHLGQSLSVFPCMLLNFCQPKVTDSETGYCFAAGWNTYIKLKVNKSATYAIHRAGTNI